MCKNNPEKVIVGMSGGVDSSVAALLLIEQGYQVEGLFMKNWDEDDGSEYCTAMADLADAQQVCDTLNIPLHTANFAADYWDNVFEHFLEEYRLGRTTIALVHSEVPEELQDQGIGSSLVVAALHHAREKELKVLPSCPFVAAYISRHEEEWADIVGEV